jgi:hypothetical protein
MAAVAFVANGGLGLGPAAASTGLQIAATTTDALRQRQPVRDRLLADVTGQRDTVHNGQVSDSDGRISHLEHA